MEIRVSHIQDIYAIHLAGRWDAFSSSEFEEICSELMKSGMRKVVIDAEAVEYVNSFGLRSLLNLGKRLDPLAGRIYMSALQPHVRQVFVGSGFISLFPEYPDTESALQAFKDIP